MIWRRKERRDPFEARYYTGGPLRPSIFASWPARIIALALVSWGLYEVLT